VVFQYGAGTARAGAESQAIVPVLVGDVVTLLALHGRDVQSHGGIV